MRMIAEEIEGSYYQDIILTENEMQELFEGHVLEGVTLIGLKRIYTGVRVNDKWIHNENINKSLDEETE